MSRTIKKKDGDIVILPSTGRSQMVVGVEKLTQDVADALMTEYEPSRGLGSQASSLDSINAQSLSGPLGAITKGMIKSFVRDALNRLKVVQRSRADQLTDFEAIGSIGIIRVVQFSKTGFMFYVNVSPVDGPDVPTSTFSVQLRHQFLEASKHNLPGAASLGIVGV